MGRLYVLEVIVISTSLLLPYSVLAGDYSLAWGDDQQIQAAMPTISTQTNPPPPYPHAHGNRSMRRYQYFPSVRVYHDAERGLYFFLQGSEWRIAVALPSELRMQLGHYITLEMESEKPYLFNDQHMHQYPPGQGEKGDAEKEKT